MPEFQQLSFVTGKCPFKVETKIISRPIIQNGTFVWIY
jgi:hypothetical protein